MTDLQYIQRIGTRMSELRDDLEVMLKAETMGTMPIMVTRAGKSHQCIRDRVTFSDTHLMH